MYPDVAIADAAHAIMLSPSEFGMDICSAELVVGFIKYHNSTEHSVPPERFASACVIVTLSYVGAPPALLVLDE
jgi:hypothetical protein